MHIAEMDLVAAPLVEIKSRTLPQGAVAACPHHFFDMNHYREDGTCKCDDPNETIIGTWGYVWSDVEHLWVLDDSE